MIVICADLTFTLFATNLDTLSPTSLVNITVDLIGCYICMVGGRLEIDSTVGEGTVATVVIPAGGLTDCR